MDELFASRLWHSRLAQSRDSDPLAFKRSGKACMASLIETCKRNGVMQRAYFMDLLTCLVNGWPQAAIDELMPWHWVPEKPS